MADVWLAPYLPQIGEALVGQWRLVPFDDLAQRHARTRAIFNEVRRLRTAYKVEAGIAGSLGAVVLPTNGRIGDELGRDLMRPLQRALTAALLDGNPSLVEDDEAGGWHTSTTENSWVFGHPLHGGHSYVIDVGTRVRTMSYSSSEPGRRLPPIPPPRELPRPSVGSFDEEYATALYGSLSNGTATSRRLDRAIEWLGFAWVNSEPVSEDARILALRASFEVLLGGGSKTHIHRAKLSELLDVPDVKRQPKQWPGGPRGPVELTALEWWFQCFANLRNAIAHGDDVEADDWLFDDGKRHLWHADDVLLRAVKRTVVNAGHDPDLEATPLERALRRGLRDTQ